MKLSPFSADHKHSFPLEVSSTFARIAEGDAPPSSISLVRAPTLLSLGAHTGGSGEEEGQRGRRLGGVA